MAKRAARSISLDSGGDEPLVLAPRAGSLIAECRGPEGGRGDAAGEIVSAAIAAATHGPPLAAHVVPGDRVAIALSGPIPEATTVVGAVRRCLEAAGVAAADVTLVDSAPERDSDTAYLGADAEGRPCHLSRPLVDADVVVAVGGFSWDASLGGRALEGELWPTFSRPAIRQDVVRRMARRGRLALADWRTEMEQVSWQLGVMASLRLVAGRAGTLAAAAFGLPHETRRAIRQLAGSWRPLVDREARMTVASLTRPRADTGGDHWRAITRAVAAASRVTHAEGTICIVGRAGAEPGVIFSRWRQGASLSGLVHEAVGTQDPQLVADALQTRLFARALGDRRLVLLSDLDETAVEELEFGYADGPAVVERLAAKAESLVVLHEADAMLPGIA